MASDTRLTRRTVRSTSGINIIAGIWLALAPFLLSYSDITGAVWNDIMIGLVVAILAWIRVDRPLLNEGVSWINLILGAWLILAPFAIGYSATVAPLWNDMIIGVVVAVLAATSAISVQRHHPSTGPHPMTG